MRVMGKDTISFSDVLVGEVWICSGQSNMEWSERNSLNADEGTDNAAFNHIRLCKVTHCVSDTLKFSFKGEWKVCSPATVGSFSAVGYFFGRAIHKQLEVPVGLIQSSWGGTPAEAWTAKSMLVSDTLLVPIVARYEKNIQDYPQKLRVYKKLIEDDKVIVWSDHVSEPVAVRYAWSDNPVCNLYNSEMLPAAPFRTDTWPGVTDGKF